MCVCVYVWARKISTKRQNWENMRDNHRSNKNCHKIKLKTLFSVFVLHFFFMFKEEIYSCEKTFERLFLGALFGTHAPYFIAGWRSDFKDQV
jgi:hypothetical protein